MNRIVIVAPDSEELGIYLQNQIDSQVEIYQDVYELNARVRNSPLRAGTLLIRDMGLNNNALKRINLKESGAMLMEVLTDNMFEVNRVIFLNVNKNERHLEVMKFVEGSPNIDIEMSIITREVYTAALVKDIIMKTNLKFDAPEKSFRYVIKRNRDDDSALGTKILEGDETDKSVLLEYPTMNANIESNRRRIGGILGQEELTRGDLRGITKIGEVEIDVKDAEKREEPAPTKIIGVVGEAKSGVSTTTMILGTSASQIQKTLIVDMNYDNLGLSYLAEKVPVPDDINRIVMSDIIQVGRATQHLKDLSFDRKKLHLLGMDLPSKSYINKEEFGFFVSNIIRQLKDSYQYIVLDIPFEDVKDYKGMMNQLDLIILTTPPYISNMVPMIQKMKENFADMPIFNDMVGTELKRIKCIRTNIFSTVPERIHPIDKDTIDKYSREIIGRTFPVTGLYKFSGRTFLDTTMFQQLVLLGTTEKENEMKLKEQQKQQKPKERTKAMNKQAKSVNEELRAKKPIRKKTRK